MSNSNNSNKIAISVEQAVQALLAAGFMFDLAQCAVQGMLCLRNNSDKTYFISDRHIFLSQFYESFDALSKHDLALCRIERGKLALGPAFSRQIVAYNLVPNAELSIQQS